MNTGSLLEKEFDENGDAVFMMHPRIREFVVYDAKEKQSIFRDSLVRVISSVHDHIHDLFSEAGRCIDDLPDCRREKLELLFPHTKSIVDHFHDSSLSCSDISCMEKLVLLHSFSIRLHRSNDGIHTADRLFCSLQKTYGTTCDNLYLASVCMTWVWLSYMTITLVTKLRTFFVKVCL